MPDSHLDRVFLKTEQCKQILLKGKQILSTCLIKLTLDSFEENWKPK